MNNSRSAELDAQFTVNLRNGANRTYDLDWNRFRIFGNRFLKVAFTLGSDFTLTKNSSKVSLQHTATSESLSEIVTVCS